VQLFFLYSAGLKKKRAPLLISKEVSIKKAKTRRASKKIATIKKIGELQKKNNGFLAKR